MKIKIWSIGLVVSFVVMLIACVPQSVQLKGTWEFVGYKAGRVESIIELDSTICFDGDGNGFFYRTGDSSTSKSFTYLLSSDHKLAIIIDGASSVVEYSIAPKTKRLSLDGLEYRLISSEMEKVVEQTNSSSMPTPMSTPTPEPTEEPTPEATSTPTPTPMPMPTPTLIPSSKNSYASISVGETIIFGKYEQDNDASNGKEDIEWLVLAREGDKALVISKYALDCQLYSSWDELPWEACIMRKWLNEEFLNAAFSSKEQKSIILSTVTADKNPKYSTSAGSDTTDKVFLLSITEANKYFSSDAERKCAPTTYAIGKGAYTQNNLCLWWLRSPGKNELTPTAAYILLVGSVNNEGGRPDRVDVAVRPTLWIDLSTISNDQPEGTVRGTISASYIALREGPGVTYKSIGTYSEGEFVYINYQEGDYYYVQVAGTVLKGYMPAQFITAEGPVPNKDS